VPNLFAHGSVGIARSLGRLGVPIYGVYDDAWAPAARSRYVRGAFFVRSLGTSEAARVQHLLDIGRELGTRAILVPIDDVASLLVQEHATRLREQFVFPEQPAGLAESLSNKKELYSLCKRQGIPTPEAMFPESKQDVVQLLERLTFPVVLKSIDPRRLHERPRAKSVSIARSREELLHQYDQMEEPRAPNLMVQEYIPGGPDSVWMFDGYFNKDSECLIGITGRKLRQHPPYTGITTLGVCVSNDDVHTTTRTLMKALGYRGMVDMGYRYDARDGRYKLFDVNPRLGATFRLFVAGNGMDVVRAMYLDLTGQSVPSGKAADGRKWLVENLDFVSAAVYFRDGRLTPSAWAASFRGLAETAWFARDDPLPFAVMWARLAWRVARRGRGRLLRALASAA
jgi:predicted ATP-grasp superfamily ATP-dependent carboligase